MKLITHYYDDVKHDTFVVKTYPSIDPHIVPPPPPYKYAYKCQINSIACCDVIISQHAIAYTRMGGGQGVPDHDSQRKKPPFHISRGK